MRERAAVRASSRGWSQDGYHWQEDAAFKTLYDQALEDALDQLEEEARRRAVDGVLKPVYQRGRQVGRILEYSDALLITLLKGKRPDTFRDRFEHTGKGGRPLMPPAFDYSKESDAELKARAQALIDKI